MNTSIPLDANRPGTMVIGAGPSGLTAALTLQRGGQPPLVLERSDQVGGLMRSPRWGDFTLDLGRKELYARFPEIDELWSEVLGADYLPYPHRVGSLYRGRIVEMSGRYRGPLRGMPLPWLVSGGLGLAAGLAAGALRQPGTLRDHWYARVGGPFARILAQGYWEKFRGTPWSALPAPEPEPADKGPRLLSAARSAARMARRGGVSGQATWRHPVRGCGQLFEGIARAFTDAGGSIAFGAEVTSLRPGPDGVAVTWTDAGARHTATFPNVVSSLPIERLWDLLDPGAAPAAAIAAPGPEALRAVLLVYLFLETPPRFPHAWLEVNDTALACGRIVNFAAFGGGMVPEGRAALCVEYFCAGDDPLLSKPEADQVALAVSETRSAGLLDPADLIGSMVVHLPRTNAAASWREQQTAHRTALFRRLAEVRSVYHVNRPGSDWASLAGLQAARAILAGDRAAFDAVADPTRRQEDDLSAA